MFLFNKVQSGQSENNMMTMSSNEVMQFLNRIHLSTYAENFCKHGYDDFFFLVDQMKTDNFLKESDLKEIGIKKAGERARIIIKLEEEAKLFAFPVPRLTYESPENTENDRTTRIKEFLQEIKLEKYYKNIIKECYFSMETLLMQMLSRFLCNK